MEDGIPRWLQHHHEMCCKKGGRHGRQACIIWRWFHRGDIISGQVDLHMTVRWGSHLKMKVRGVGLDMHRV